MQYNIGVKDGFSCINIYKVSKELLENKVERRGFQQPQKDMENVNAMKNHV